MRFVRKTWAVATLVGLCLMSGASALADGVDPGERKCPEGEECYEKRPEPLIAIGWDGEAAARECRFLTETPSGDTFDLLESCELAIPTDIAILEADPGDDATENTDDDLILIENPVGGSVDCIGYREDFRLVTDVSMSMSAGTPVAKIAKPIALSFGSGGPGMGTLGTVDLDLNAFSYSIPFTATMSLEDLHEDMWDEMTADFEVSDFEGYWIVEEETVSAKPVTELSLEVPEFLLDTWVELRTDDSNHATWTVCGGLDN